MSYVYNKEPPTSGKLIIKTTYGDLEIELWPKEAPKAVRNFVQLCMEGYYDNTIFHRVVKGFIVQGGDPTATGTGGESIYGEPFSDEFHSRLRFTHRGLLAMANTGRHTNKSQFFFTLDKTEELNGKNTIFGKIVGDTIFNLLKIGDSEVDDNERPLFPPKIISVEILSNPFDDIEPRVTREEKAAMEWERVNALAKAQLDKRIKAPAKKSLNLLSFGEDEEQSAIKDTGTTRKIQSRHDLLHDERFSKEVAVTDADLRKQAKEVAAQSTSDTKKRRAGDSDDDDMDSDDAKRKEREKAAAAAKKRAKAASKAKGPDVQSEIERVQNEIRQMEASRRKGKDDGKKKNISFVDSFRQKYAGKALMGRRQKGTDNSLLDELASFKSKVLGSDLVAAKPVGVACALHGVEGCKSCRKDDEVEDEDDSGWMGHRLKFKKDANVYEPTVDDYVYFDPREEKAGVLRPEKEERQKQPKRM